MLFYRLEEFLKLSIDQLGMYLLTTDRAEVPWGESLAQPLGGISRRVFRLFLQLLISLEYFLRHFEVGSKLLKFALQFIESRFALQHTLLQHIEPLLIAQRLHAVGDLLRMVSVILPLLHLYLAVQLGDLGIKFSYGVQLSLLLWAKLCEALPIGFLLPLDLLYP